MGAIAIILPPLALLAALRLDDLRESFLRSAALSGLFLVFSTELLSAASLIDYPAVAACWSVFLLALLACRYRGKKTAGRFSLPATTPTQKILLALIICLSFTTLITALVAAPNNFDSLTYHLPRVMHWIQDRSVRHYPTNVDRQLVLAPFSEYAIMHLQILSGSDRFANCVQWLAMLGSALGVSLIVRELQGCLNAQIVAAALTVSLPMGLLQSTSTQNDYVLAFWLVCLVYFILKGWQRPDARGAAYVGATLGLAIFTKGTAYLAAFPFMAVYLYRLFRAGPKRAAAGVLVAASAVALINGSHLARNFEVYGNPLTPGTRNDIVCTRVDAGSVISCVTRNLATELSSGWQPANAALGAAVSLVHRAIKVAPDDPRLTTSDGFFIIPPQLDNHEDYAPNPVQMALMLLAAAVMALRWKALPKRAVALTAATMAAFVMVSAGIKWNPFVSRYFLPVLVLSAPLVALLFDAEKSRKLVGLCAVLLLVFSFTVPINNARRPLTGPHSIFVTDRIDQYFAARPEAKPYFGSLAGMVKAQGLTNVGILNGSGNMLEYLLWVLLKDGAVKYRIEHVEVGNASGRIKLQNFYTYFPVSI